MGTNHEDTHINESILSEEILEDQKKNRIDHMTYLPGMEDQKYSTRSWQPWRLMIIIHIQQKM